MKRMLIAPALAFAAFLGGLGVSQPAQACQPPMQSLSSTIPQDGEHYPANAAVVFRGYGISLSSVTVKVDGQSATLVPDLHFPDLYEHRVLINTKPDPPALVARIQPQPVEGQEVLIEGIFCPGNTEEAENLEYSRCGEQSLRYTASAPDTTPPPAPESASLAFYNYSDFHTNGFGCELDDSSFTYWLHWGLGHSPSAGEAPLRYVIEQEDPDKQGASPWRRDMVGPRTGDVVRDIGSLDGSSCFTIRAFDLAGNEAAASSLVCPSSCRADRAGAPANESLPEEPAWSDADVCGPEFEATLNAEGESEPASSGGCRLDAHRPSGSTPWGASAVLAMLGALIRTRRNHPS